MTTADLLAAAEEARPDLMQKTAAMLGLLERLSPEHELEVRAELAKIASYTNEKVAAAEGYGPAARFGLAVGGTLLAGLAGSVATDMYDAAKRGLTKGTNFKRILRANPELKHFEKERLHNSFDALHRYAPEFTADPILGGSLLKSVAEVPGNEHVVIKDLINARKNLQDAKHTQFTPGKSEIEVPSSADIAADAARSASETRRSAERHGYDMEMLAIRAKLDREREERDAGRRRQEGKDKFRRDVRLTTLRTQLDRGFEGKHSKKDPVR